MQRERARRLRGRGHPRRRLRAALRPGPDRRRLPAGRPVPAARQRVHDGRRGVGRGRAQRHQLHPAAASNGAPHPAVLYAAHASGAERVFAIGGVQALAAMAFGLLDAPRLRTCSSEPATPMWQRQSASCSGGSASTCSPVRPRSPSSPTTPRRPQMVAADLLGQAEHGPTSPACLVTTSERLGSRGARRDRPPAGRRCPPARSPARRGGTTGRSTSSTAASWPST